MYKMELMGNILEWNSALDIDNGDYFYSTKILIHDEEVFEWLMLNPNITSKLYEFTLINSDNSKHVIGGIGQVVVENTQDDVCIDIAPNLFSTRVGFKHQHLYVLSEYVRDISQ